jgi:predicted amino acid-binding ACT domain protein
MPGRSIRKSKSTVQAADHIPAKKKTELLSVLSKMETGIVRVSQTHAEHALSIAKLVEASAREATRKKKRPEHLKKLLQELKQSAESFEASHPGLVASVTEYSAFLSALGI